MDRINRQRALKIVKLLAPEDFERLVKAEIHVSDFGYDQFGLERESAMLAFALLQFLYRYWFRVQSYGVEHVPQEGPVLIVPNHSGGIPIDGVMIALDLAKKMEKPRVVRAAIDNFAGFLPFLNTFFYRCGQVIGARKNLAELLAKGEVIAVFPEGHKGTGKRFKDRYKPLLFNVGFVELSLIHKAPIVPTAVIGAEEQYPYMLNLKPLAKILSLPYFPANPLALLLGPAGMIPLPTKYYIYYGEPVHLYREYSVDTIQDPEMLRRLANDVRIRVIELIRKGLKYRKGIFGISFSVGRDFLQSEMNRKIEAAIEYLAREPISYLSSRRKASSSETGAKEIQNRIRQENVSDRNGPLESALEERMNELEIAIFQLQRRMNERREVEQAHQRLH